MAPNVRQVSEKVVINTDENIVLKTGLKDVEFKALMQTKGLPEGRKQKGVIELVKLYKDESTEKLISHSNFVDRKLTDLIDIKSDELYLDICQQLFLTAYHYLYLTVGVVHNDLSLENTLFDQTGFIAICAFGKARERINGITETWGQLKQLIETFENLLNKCSPKMELKIFESFENFRSQVENIIHKFQQVTLENFTEETVYSLEKVKCLAVFIFAI